MNLKKYIKLSVLVLFIYSGCAKIGVITGGPKDLDPPKLLKCDPENYSVKFNKKKIEITFDEFIQLKDFNNEFIISPPTKKKPTTLLKNKTLIVNLPDSLAENTTYTLSFGNAIADNNEGNVLKDFEYVFSTGDELDSMAVAGKVLNAFDLKIDKDPYFLLLHENLSDSAPFKINPTYVGKTNTQGNFIIKNIKEGTYRLYAIKGGSSNYKYTPVTKAIAFNDSLLYLNHVDIKPQPKRQKKDTVKLKKPVLKDANDTAKVKKDTVVILPDYIVFTKLYAFFEKDNKQYIKDSKWIDRRRLRLGFNISQEDEPEIKPVNFKSEDFFLAEYSPKKDSVSLWIKDSALYKRDTMTLSVEYYNPYKDKQKIDTIRFSFIEETKNKGKKSKKKKKESNVLKFSITNSIINLKEALSIESTYPVVAIDTARIRLIETKDSTDKVKHYQLIRDSLCPRKYYIKYPWDEDLKYKLNIYPGAVSDIYDLGNDTIVNKLTVQKADYYGNIFINFTNVQMSMIVQLLEKDKIIVQKIVKSGGKVTFDYLQPKTYNIKVIYDSNDNGIWDTGDLLNKIQPEKVFFYNDEIKVRSNWDNEVNWKLE